MFDYQINNLQSMIQPRVLIKVDGGCVCVARWVAECCCHITIPNICAWINKVHLSVLWETSKIKRLFDESDYHHRLRASELWTRQLSTLTGGWLSPREENLEWDTLMERERNHKAQRWQMIGGHRCVLFWSLSRLFGFSSSATAQFCGGKKTEKLFSDSSSSRMTTFQGRMKTVAYWERTMKAWTYFTVLTVVCVSSGHSARVNELLTLQTPGTRVNSWKC